MTSPQELARILKVLSVPTRLSIVQRLKPGPLCVGALAADLDVTQGAVSQHLRLLRDAGLVVPERRGCFIHYRLDERTMAQWQEATRDLLDAAKVPADRHADRATCRKEDGRCAARKKKVAGGRRT